MKGFPTCPAQKLATLVLNLILLYFSTKSTEVDALNSTHFSPAEVAAADRSEIVPIYFMKQGTNIEQTQVGPIVLAKGGEVFALNVIPI